MKLLNYGGLIVLALAAASSLSAAEITGKVRDASGDAATIVIDGDALPAVGDSAEIFFKLPGVEEEISVASGKVASVEAKVVKIKIEKTTGTIEKDHFARIKSGSSPQASGASPAATSSPSGTAATGSSITGDWVSNLPDSHTFSLSFKEDGTLLWVAEDAQFAESTGGKYRVDASTQPRSIELSDLQEGEVKGMRLRGIFELQSDGRLKLDFARDEEPPPKEFTNKAVVFSKATSPVVRSNKPPPPPPTPYVAPVTPPDEKLLEEGKDLFRRKDYDGAIKAYTKAIELNPKNANAFYWRGICFSEMKNEAAELADYEKAQALDPTMRLQTLIDAMKQTQRVDRELATESPTPATPTVTPASTPDEALVAAAIQLYEHGADAAAMEALEKAIALNPKNARAYYYRGLCFHRKNDRRAAIADFEKARELDPTLDWREMTAKPTPTRAKKKRKP